MADLVDANRHKHVVDIVAIKLNTLLIAQVNCVAQSPRNAILSDQDFSVAGVLVFNPTEQFS